MTDDILLKEFPECVRSCPGMYIGDQSTPLKLLSEIIDNAFDEVQYGANQVSITTEGSHYIVIDNGRGIPVRKVLATNSTPLNLISASQAELSIATLHSGSKFSKTSIAAGMNGVGSACTNALSKEYIILSTLGENNHRLNEMHPDLQAMYEGGDYHYIWYQYGVRKEIGFCSLKDFKELFGIELPKIKFRPSTLVAFQPDPEMFDSVKCDIPNTIRYVSTMNKYLNRKLDITINDELSKCELDPFSSTIHSVINTTLTSDPLLIKNPKLELFISFGVNPIWNMKDCTGSVNGLFTPRGLHIRAFLNAFSEAWKSQYGMSNGVEFTSLNYWVIGLCNQPQFGSQTKVDCCTINGIDIRNNRELIKLIVGEFKRYPEIWDVYAEKVRAQIRNSKDLSRVDFIRSRIVIASEVKKAERFLPARLKDCTSPNRKDCELWLTEGRSASGTLMQARDPSKHAVLGLRGIPMNGSGASLDSVLENSELRDYISCIGLGVDEHYNLSKVRYGKIVICADADPDGLYIASSLCGTTATHMRFLIEHGFLHIAMPPLYEQDGKYFYDEEDFKSLNRSKKFTRFKGIGEMRPDQFKASLLDQNNRRLFKVTLEGISEALGIINSTQGRRNLMLESGIIKSTRYGESNA